MKSAHIGFDLLCMDKLNMKNIVGDLTKENHFN